jgi:hypothetical protein
LPEEREIKGYKGFKIKGFKRFKGYKIKGFKDYRFPFLLSLLSLESLRFRLYRSLSQPFHSRPPQDVLRGGRLED